MFDKQTGACHKRKNRRLSCKKEKNTWKRGLSAFRCYSQTMADNQKLAYSWGNMIFAFWNRVFLGIKPSTSIWVPAQKAHFCLIFLALFSFFYIFHVKPWKRHISTSVLKAKHPNAGRNIHWLWPWWTYKKIYLLFFYLFLSYFLTSFPPSFPPSFYFFLLSSCLSFLF